MNRQAVGVMEAKKKGTTLSGVKWQTVKYQTTCPMREESPHLALRLQRTPVLPPPPASDASGAGRKARPRR